MLRRRLMGNDNKELTLNSYDGYVNAESGSLEIGVYLGGSPLINGDLSLSFNGQIWYARYNSSIGTIRIWYDGNEDMEWDAYGELTVTYKNQSKTFNLTQSPDLILYEEEGVLVEEHSYDDSTVINVCGYYSLYVGTSTNAFNRIEVYINKEIFSSYATQLVYESGRKEFDQDTLYYVKTGEETITAHTYRGVGDPNSTFNIGDTRTWTRNGYEMWVERISDTELHWVCDTTGDEGYGAWEKA